MKIVADLRFACQTYSWQMSIDRYRGRLRHMASIAAAAGFAGFEPEVIMLGDAWTGPELRDVLAESGLDLAALVLVQNWRAPTESEVERNAADLVIQATMLMPGARINLCQAPGADREHLAERQRNAMTCMAAVARRAADVGVSCTFHPNSPPGSVFRTADDYRVMADLLPANIGYTPDLGHIAKGGMDPLEVVRRWRGRVDHVHVKDIAADGSWAPTGQGIVDIRGVLELLVSWGYGGWITFEDESPDAEGDPDTATANNGRYVHDIRKAMQQ